jgi:mannose-6-phosphate isomerase-like protein (cupin superfamily)
MRVIRQHETTCEENSRLLMDAMMSAQVMGCGLAEFAPGLVAHEGEVHVHEHDEVFVVTSGEILVPVEGSAGVVARAGDWIFVEAGLEHHLTNQSVLPCRAIYIVLKQETHSQTKTGEICD